MKALFRVDASRTIGLGHMMRCLSLADGLLRQGLEVRFCCKNSNGLYNDLVHSSGYRLLLLHDDCDSNELVQMNVLIDIYKPDVIVLDGYQFNYRYQRKLNTGKAILVDMAWEDDFRSCADLIINQNIWASEHYYNGLVKDNAELLLGTKYALIAPAYRDRREALRRKCSNILITFGGGLNSNYGLDIYNLVKNCPFSFTVLLDSTTDYKIKINDIRLNIIKDCYDILPLVQAADIAICAPGSISWELCCLGVPFIMYTTSKNQEPTAIGLQKHGIAINLGKVENLDAAKVIKAIYSLSDSYETRKNMSYKAKLLVDGLGVERVATEIVTLINCKRKGRLSDE